MSSTMSDRRRPVTSGANSSIAAQHRSLPWPMVNVIPWPWCALSVCSTTYAAE
jgi:hypothetical protein